MGRNQSTERINEANSSTQQETAWGRIEARTYDEAVELLEKLSQLPAALVEGAEPRWSIYVSANADELPRMIHGAGVDPERLRIVPPPPEGFGADQGGSSGRPGRPS